MNRVITIRSQFLLWLLGFGKPSAHKGDPFPIRGPVYMPLHLWLQYLRLRLRHLRDWPGYIRSL